MDPGDPKAAEDLLPLVYQELRRMAAQRLAGEQRQHTLQPTALVHEAWLRMCGSEQRQWNDRQHFFATAIEAMRRILVDGARRRLAAKRGGGVACVDANDLELPSLHQTNNFSTSTMPWKSLPGWTRGRPNWSSCATSPA